MTPRDVDKILEALGQLGEKIAVLETKLEGIESHDVRLRKLENRWAMLTGIVTLIGIELQVMGVIIAIINQVGGK